MKRVAGTIAVLLLVTVACAPQGRPDDGYDESLYRNREGGGMDTVDNITGRGRPQGRDVNQIGFSRQKGNEFYNATDGGSVPGPDVYIDRNILARHISFLTTKLPRVDDCSVVVTDDQVFIGVKGKQGEVSRKTLFEAKRTALSLTPRYYQVHVTADPQLREKLNQIGNRSLGNNEKLGVEREEMDKLLEEMGDSTPPN